VLVARKGEEAKQTGGFALLIFAAYRCVPLPANQIRYCHGGSKIQRRVEELRAQRTTSFPTILNGNSPPLTCSILRTHVAIVPQQCAPLFMLCANQCFGGS
jgi:hypothetical protein